jgi:hypothetical protein
LKGACCDAVTHVGGKTYLSTFDFQLLGEPNEHMPEGPIYQTANFFVREKAFENLIPF